MLEDASIRIEALIFAFGFLILARVDDSEVMRAVYGVFGLIFTLNWIFRTFTDRAR